MAYSLLGAGIVLMVASLYIGDWKGPEERRLLPMRLFMPAEAHLARLASKVPLPVHLFVVGWLLVALGCGWLLSA